MGRHFGGIQGREQIERPLLLLNRCGSLRLELMDLAGVYKQQFGWRDWPTIFGALPVLEGQLVLDLGCGVGDLTVEFVARGARVIGIDANEELLSAARSRQIPNAEFRSGDVRTLPDLLAADGIWCSFAAAYFPNLPEVLTSWRNSLRPGGWIALTEVNDLFGHEPLSAEAKALFDAYAADALVAQRYDFHMGRKLRAHLEKSGFTVSTAFAVYDQELSFSGPAHPDVVGAWRSRLDGMKLFQSLCGTRFNEVRDEFLGCLMRPDHTSIASVRCCIATNGI